MVKCQGKNKKLLKTIDYGLKKSIRLRRISILNSDYCILYLASDPYPAIRKPHLEVSNRFPPQTDQKEGFKEKGVVRM